MRILFDSKKTVFKDPFGTLVPEQVCTLHIHIPSSVGALEAECILCPDDGSQELRVPMILETRLGAYDVFQGSFCLKNTGLFFYYFTVTKKEINGTYTDKTDGTTFKALTALSGSGKIDGQTVNVGDTFFIPADYGSFTLTGNMTAVITEIRKYNAKMDAKNAYITDDLGNIIVSAKLGNNVGNTIDKLLSSLNMSRADIE